MDHWSMYKEQWMIGKEIVWELESVESQFICRVLAISECWNDWKNGLILLDL